MEIADDPRSIVLTTQSSGLNGDFLTIGKKAMIEIDINPVPLTGVARLAKKNRFRWNTAAGSTFSAVGANTYFPSWTVAPLM